MVWSASSPRRAVALVVSLVLLLMWVPNLLTVQRALATGTHAGFEIDGNLVSNGGTDWNSASVQPQPIENDNVGGDPTVYKGDSSSKEDQPPSGWNVGGSPPVKDDINNVYGTTANDNNGTPADPTDDHPFVFFAFDRLGGTGTDYYYLELNKLPAANTASHYPVRSPGDSRFKLKDQGGGVIALISVSTWNGTDWDEIVIDDLATQAEKDALLAGFDYAVSADETFLEFSFDLNVLLGLIPSCPEAFGSLQFRNATGNSDKNLKDFIVPLALHAGNSCGILKIEKRAGSTTGTLLAGATFRITADPTPGSNAPNILITDNDTSPAAGHIADADPAAGKITVDPAKPGNYTVKEVSPPPGYVIDDSSEVSVTVPVGGTSATKIFTDSLGSIAWEKVDATSGAHICCATFTVHRTGPAGVTQNDVTVTDNDTGDVDNRDGYIKVDGLKTGNYTITETAAPTGYDLPADPDQTTTITDVYAARDVTIETAFSDPRKTSTLKVKKVDEGNQGLPGATFQLWKESGQTAGLQTNEDSQIGSDCVTDANGFCTKSGLDFGTYYWKETVAPTGYNLPANPVSTAIVINAGNAGSTFPTTTFTDTQILSSLTVKKVDADHPSVVLSGATFELWKESGQTAGLQTSGVDADTKIGSDCVTDSSGLCSKSGLSFGSYYWRETTAPTGYDLPATTVQGPIVINANNAGGNPVSTTTFSDPEQTSGLRVEKIDADHPAVHLQGAVFELWQESGTTTGLQTSGVDADVLVNGNCSTNANGFCSVNGLKFGSYYWREITAPTGYDLPATTVQGPIVIDASNAGGNPISTTTFSDPEKVSSLRVEKVDADHPAVHLAGATFQLRKESGQTAGFQANEDSQVGSDCITPASGFCTVGSLKFGTYYWLETAAPTGYDLPATTVQGPIVIDASNAGGNPISTTTFSDPEKRTPLTVKKVDGDNPDKPLSGATFKLWHESGSAAGLQTSGGNVDDVVNTCQTGVDGTCSIGNLLFGTYYWQETAAPTGYNLPDPDHSGAIVIDANNAGTTLATTVFTDPQVLSSLSVEKTDEATGDPLEGAQFSLRKQVGATQAPATDPVVDSCTTDGTGVCTASNLHFGSYYWYEEAPPAGYNLPATRTTPTVTIDASNAGTVFTTQVITDPQITSSLRVRKLDATTQAVVSGATFQLWLESNATAGLQRTGTADTLVDSCTTDGTGMCKIGSLAFGTYYWYESGVPTGYDAPANRTSGPIVVDAGNAGGDPISTTDFSDPQTLSSLKVKKVDADTGAALSGVLFDLYVDDNGTVGLQTGGGTPDTKVDSCTTGGDGTCTISGLHFGSYWWVENAAPTGYQLPNPAYAGPITIDRSNAGTVFATTTFRDPQVLSSLTVKKVDQQTKALLAGADFDLHHQLGASPMPGTDPVVDSCTTDGTGTCTISDLNFGTYYWVETKAPTGYNLPPDVVSDPITIDASNAGTTLAVTSFSDPEKLTSLTVEKIDAEDQSTLADAHFTLWRDSNGTAGLQTGGGTPDTDVNACVTDGTGTCSIGSLVFGTYYWQETQAPKGYNLPGTTVSDPIVIDASNAGTTIPITVFGDPQKPTVLTVEKVDQQTQALLAGGHFSLYKESNSVAGLQIDGTADTHVDDCVTDNSGTCSVGNLLFGTYYWMETAAPTGYNLPADTVSDPIVLDADNAGTVMTATVFSDPEVPTALTVSKVEAGSKIPLADADFQLWEETNATAGLQTDGGNPDTKSGQCTTDSSGTCSVDNLLFGTYYWLEVKAPTGYVLPSNPVSDPFVIDADNAGSRELPVTSFSDAQVLSEVFVKKVDAETGDTLAGATFELWQLNGDAADSLVESCTTDASGTCSVADLPFGTYYWVETAAPDGYLLPDNPVSEQFVINADNAGTALAVVTFGDTPTGAMTIHKDVDKTSALYGDTLTYTISLHADGPRLQNDVTLTDFVPGYDPDDTVSGKVTYVDGSADCSVACSTSYDAVGHTLTWKLDGSIPPPNDVTLTFKATIDTPSADANGGLPAEQLDNVAVVKSDHTPTTPSNKVITRIVAVLGEKVVKPPKALPFTGAPLPVRMAIVLGTLMIGAGLIVNVSWRRRRS